MSATSLPPPPNANSDMDDYSWKDWFRVLRDYLTGVGAFSWGVINFTGSNIKDIQQRQHNELQAIQGGTAGDYVHLTSAQLSGLTGNGKTTLHSHDIGTPTAGTGLTLKTTQYITVDIGGTTYKLALVN